MSTTNSKPEEGTDDELPCITSEHHPLHQLVIARHILEQTDTHHLGNSARSNLLTALENIDDAIHQGLDEVVLGDVEPKYHE